MHFLGSGSVKIYGCGEYYFSYFHIIPKFSVGEIAYDKNVLLEKCLLRKVVIKKVIVRANYNLLGDYQILYKDTLNGLWNENELLGEQLAYQMWQQCLSNYRQPQEIARENC